MAGAAAGAIPEKISFQGRLLNSAGSPVADGSYSITFNIYGSGGTLAWSETHPSVQTTGGLFSVLLGTYTSFPADLFSDQLELGVQVSGDVEMTPRFALASAPYAMTAKQALSVASEQWVNTTGDSMTGALTIDAGGTYGLNATTSNSSGTAVRGYASSVTGTTYGVYGQCLSASGYGVYSSGRMHATAAISTTSSVIAGTDFRYSSAKPFYLNLHPSAFMKGNMNADNVWMVTFGEGGYIDSGAFLTARLFAPVHLPDGASLTALRVYYYDNNASSDVHGNVSLLRRPNSATDSQTVASVSIVSSGQQDAVIEASVVASGTIDNANNQYYVLVIFQPDTYGNTLRFYGCRIDYQIQTLCP